MPNVNPETVACVHCGENIPAGLGRQIGKAAFVHNDAHCLRGSRAAYAPPRRYERQSISRTVGRAARALFAPALALVVVLGCAAASTGDYARQDQQLIGGQ